MLKFAFKNMAIKKAKIFLVILSIVISATVAILAYNIAQQVDEGFKTTASYYDTIIGPSGSSTQLAMNTMFFTDKPLGTISYKYVERLDADERVNVVIPFTMGDSYGASKIVGTTSQFIESKELDSGELFDEVFEAVVGYEVALKYGFDIGDTFVTSHGLSEGGHAHEGNPLTVVGILKKTNTSYDNVIFTHIETVWATHDHAGEDEHEEHHGDVCAILLRCKNPNTVASIKNEYGKNGELLVINPSEVLREILENVDMTTDIVYILCIIILFMNIMVISIITLLNMYDSKKEIQLMRLIGISMNKINMLYIIQNAIIGLIATAISFACSRGCIMMIGSYVASMGIVLDITKVYPIEFIIMSVVFIISIVPTVACTMNLSRKDGISE